MTASTKREGKELPKYRVPAMRLVKGAPMTNDEEPTNEAWLRNRVPAMSDGLDAQIDSDFAEMTES